MGSPEKELELGLAFTPKQERMHASTKRFRIVKGGRRSTKSTYAAMWQTLCAWNGPPVQHWYVAKTYKQAKTIIWRTFIDVIPKVLIKSIDARELEIALVNGAVICLKGGDKEDTLRGTKLGSLVQDEAAFHKHTLFPRVLEPMLADMEAPALLISSPRPGWFVQMYDKVIKGRLPEWDAFHLTIYDNPHIKRKEIERIRKSNSDRLFRQEYMGENVDEGGQVYCEFSEQNICNGSIDFPDFKKWPAVVGIDYGLHDPTGICWLHPHDGNVYMSYEHIRAGWDVHKHAVSYKEISTGLNIRAAVLDPSMFRREGTSMTSIGDQFRKNGIPVQRGTKDDRNRKDIMKRYLREGRLFIDAECRGMIDALELWEHGQHEPDILAACGYALEWIDHRGMSRAIVSTRRDEQLFDTNEPRFKMHNPKVNRMRFDTEHGVPY